METLTATPKATFYVNELACDIAEWILEYKFEGNKYLEDENGDTYYTEEAQDEFNFIYDQIESILLTNKLK